MADISAWYKEVIKDKVTMKFQAHGGMLDGTMTGGDTQANTVKFPVLNSELTMYELTGAIQPIPTTKVDVGTVQLTMKDFECVAWWLTQDAYKSGPSEQDAAARAVVKAQRRKRDRIKIDALTAFSNLGPGNGVTTIGDGSARIDITHLEQARSEIEATGAESEEEAQIYCMLPSMWMSQLCFYKEFAESTWVGTENMPFSKTQRAMTKTVRGVHYIVCPDSYFTEYAAGQLEIFMWHKDSIGAETPVNQENVFMDRDHTKEGSPYFIKNWLSGASIGIQGAGVKRLRMQKIASPVRPA